MQAGPSRRIGGLHELNGSMTLTANRPRIHENTDHYASDKATGGAEGCQLHAAEHRSMVVAAKNLLIVLE